MPETQDSMFKITPMDEDTSENDNVKSVEKFVKQAVSDGYLGKIVDKAAKIAETKDCGSYEEFEEIIDEVICSEEAENDRLTKKRERIKKSIDIELSRLSKMQNIAQYANYCIYRVYGTHSVTIADILYMATEESLNLELYQEPIYSVIIQIESDWVSEAVNKIMNGWTEKEYPKKFVEDYLKSQNIPEELFDSKKKELITYLSVDYQNDIAPDEFKQFKAVQQLLGQYDSNSLLNNEEGLIQFGGTLTADMDEGLPSEASVHDATKSALEKVSGKAGELCGKAIALKYKTAKNFEDVMYESLGEYGDAYKEHKEEIRERKEQIKESREEEKLQKAKIQSEEKVELERIKSEERIRKQERTVSDSYGFRSREDTYYERQNKNIGERKLLVPIIVLVCNIIAALVSLLFMSPITSFIAVAGLTLATIGMFMVGKETLKAMLMIIGGYLVFILSFSFI